ncbi:hypothetical protein [Nocardia sp. NPDC052112]|uniref:hypothetical protein n=1 Tax=Nocardia sp. NPDC052112 TaxID=3155646 RepID=UPI003413EFC0
MAGSDNFGIDPEQVKAQAPKFAELASQLTTGLAALRNGLAEHGESWGNDEFGNRFAQNYVHKADEALEGIEGAVLLFQFLEKGVGLTADTFEGFDQEFKDALTKVTRNLDGKG